MRFKVALLALLPLLGRGAIAFDAAANSGLHGTAASYSYNHTCTGSNLLLVVAVAFRGSSGTVSGITYNSVALTNVANASNSVLARRISYWYLFAPSTGTNSVAVTFSVAPTTDSIATSVSYTGVDTTAGGPDASNNASGTSTAPSVNVTTVAANCMVIDAMATTVVITGVGSGQTARVQDQGGANIRGNMSEEGPVAASTTVTMDWTLGSSVNWAIGAASFKPATGGAPAVNPRLTVLGVAE